MYVCMYVYKSIFNVILHISDKDLVPEPPDQVEEEVHQRPRAARPAVLQLPRQHGAQAHGPRGQAMVGWFFFLSFNGNISIFGAITNIFTHAACPHFFFYLT